MTIKILKIGCYKIHIHEFSILQFLHHNLSDSVHVGLSEWNTGMWTAGISPQPASELQEREIDTRQKSEEHIIMHCLPDIQTHHSLKPLTVLVVPE